MARAPAVFRWRHRRCQTADRRRERKERRRRKLRISRGTRTAIVSPDLNWKMINVRCFVPGSQPILSLSFSLFLCGFGSIANSVDNFGASLFAFPRDYQRGNSRNAGVWIGEGGIEEKRFGGSDRSVIPAPVLMYPQRPCSRILTNMVPTAISPPLGRMDSHPPSRMTPHGPNCRRRRALISRNAANR